MGLLAHMARCDAPRITGGRNLLVAIRFIPNEVVKMLLTGNFAPCYSYGDRAENFLEIPDYLFLNVPNAIIPKSS